MTPLSASAISTREERAILLMQCPDQTGIVARVSAFIQQCGGNILQFDQYSTDPPNGRYFMRVEFSFNPDGVSREKIVGDFGVISRELNAQSIFHNPHNPLRMGILVSRYDHCLYDLLYRFKSGEFSAAVPCIISNHQDCAQIASLFGVPFHWIPSGAGTKQAREEKMLSYVSSTTDFLVLARYMQIITSEFLTAYGKDIINIHHSFLPSFKGADPYRQAYARGVKVIGATAHYVTVDLDEGPIIEQMVDRVSHRDSVEVLMRKGRNLEKLALSGAVRSHLEHRIIRFENKTVVFE